MAEMFTLLVSIGALCLATVSVGMTVALVRPQHTPAQQMKRVSGMWVFVVGLAVSLAALALSLVYSELIGYEPCELCWYQRISIYPQVIIFGIGLISRASPSSGGRELLTSSLVLSVIGGVTAVIHIFTQALSAPSLFCQTTGAASCSEYYFQVFGFVSFPVLSLIAFTFLTVVVGYALWHWNGMPPGTE